MSKITAIPILFFILAMTCLYSCVDSKKATYFYSQKDSTIASVTKIPETLIQPNDILNISVSSLNPQATAIFNSPNASMSNNAGNELIPQTVGYLVASTGEIQFPVLGAVKVSGLSTNQLREQLTTSLVSKKLLVDPIVTIRFLNFKVSVLGEVLRPTVISVPSEKISLLEALGFAGDITVSGKKDNVMIIREENGARTIKRINLNTSELFTSPYYYLKSNDIVYVETNKAKIASSGRSNQLLPIILSALSFAAIIIDRVTR